jgi:hypothetical protein
MSDEFDGLDAMEKAGVGTTLNRCRAAPQPVGRLLRAPGSKGAGKTRSRAAWKQQALPFLWNRTVSVAQKYVIVA